MPRSPATEWTSAPWGGSDTLDGPLDLVEQGQHITGSHGLPSGTRFAKMNPVAGSDTNAGFAAKLGGAIALAFEDRGNGGI